MNKKSSTKQNARAVITASIISCVLLFAMPSKATEGRTNNEDPAKKSTEKNKTLASRNNASVKIFPDIFKRHMYVVAKGNEGKEIDFFVFDLQGTLVQNYKMKAKDRRRMADMQRGSYIYRVFCGDEETASGTFQIR